MNLKQLCRQLDLYGHNPDMIPSDFLKDLLEIVNDFYANVFDEVKETASGTFKKLDEVIAHLKRERKALLKQVREYERQVSNQSNEIQFLKDALHRAHSPQPVYPTQQPPILPTTTDDYTKPTAPVWTSKLQYKLDHAATRGDVQTMGELEKLKLASNEYKEAVLKMNACAKDDKTKPKTLVEHLKETIDKLSNK